jgi:ssDNA thymidine ADP-ribosyltransferase, DarT
VPFYFTPFSVMMRNILSGRGVPMRSKDELVILVSSIHHLAERGLPFLFTDMHAYYQWANYYNKLAELNKIDWELLQRRDFKRDPDDPAKFERYQAEALIHRHCPVDGLLGIMCYTEQLQQTIAQQIQSRGLKLQVHARPRWYF